MSNSFDDLQKAFNRLQADMPNVMNKLAVGEGVDVVDNATRITGEEKIYRSRNYERSWHSDDVAKVEGDEYSVEVGNTADYAEYIEKGFRRHFVPGYWEGDIFVYDPSAKGGATFGPYTGKRVLERSMKETEATQQARLERKLRKMLKDYL